MSKKTTTTVARSVTVLARYELKQDYTDSNGKLYKAGWVILWVENDRGERYHVTLRANGDSCSCASRKCCYHVKAARATEDARTARQQQEVAKVERAQQTLARQLATAPALAGTEALIARSSLTSNHGFSLYR